MFSPPCSAPVSTPDTATWFSDSILQTGVHSILSNESDSTVDDPFNEWIVHPDDLEPHPQTVSSLTLLDDGLVCPRGWLPLVVGFSDASFSPSARFAARVQGIRLFRQLAERALVHRHDQQPSVERHREYSRPREPSIDDARLIASSPFR